MKPSVHYITVAHGPFYERAVLGLRRSFRRHSSGPMLHEVEVGGWSQANYDKVRVVSTYASKVKRGDHATCWIDADTLVLCDLGEYLDPYRINVIRHGACKLDREVTDTLVVPADSYLLSGLFCVPPWAARGLDEVVASGALEGGERGIYDQKALNVLANSIVSSAFALDTLAGLWNWAGIRDHPSPENDTFCRCLRLRAGQLCFGSEKVMVLHWTARSLKAHLDTDFEAIMDPGARYYLKELYRADERA